MKKKLLLLFAAFATLVASAQAKVKIDGIYYNIISETDKLAEVTFKGDSYDSYHDEYFGSITIPATVTHNGVAYSVTSIGNEAFRGCPDLASIILPEGVTSIGEYAFNNCSSLTSITIPENSQLMSIGELAFLGCSGLTTISIPEGVTSIGDWAFSYCSSLTSITIPESVTSIGEHAFEDCSSLTSVHVSSIEAWCYIDFEDSYANPLRYAKNLYINGELVTELAISNSVTAIKDYAFYNCSSLTSITIPEGVKSIGNVTFFGCSSLTSITLPEGVTSIGIGFFYGCSSLTTITIPESVTSIGESAFSYCSSLATITIPEGVTSIGKSAFSYCCSLTDIVLPEKLKSVGSKAFADCPKLSDVYCYAETVPGTEANAFDGSNPGYATLHVPASAMNDYKTTAPWSSFGKIIALGASITEITLSESSATLTEGEDLTLTMTTNPENVDRNLISWSSSNPSVATVDNTGKVTAIAPGTATITATANDGSGVSAQCELTVNELILGKCATPTISYVDAKVIFACDTEGAIVKSSVKEYIEGNYDDMAFDLIPTYTLTAYATKKDYEDSDEVTLTLCWLPCTKEHKEDEGSNEEGEEEDNSITIPSKPVLISTQGGTITVSGLDAGTAVAAYSTAGTSLATATATDGTATLATNLEAGSIAIVKIGNYSIKVAIK